MKDDNNSNSFLLSFPPDYGPTENNNSVINSNLISVMPRDGFRASPGYSLLAADYSQIELRIMAHFSR